jgi:hypothetical protein
MCLVTEHQFHNVILLGEAVEAARVDASDLCVEASIFQEEIEVELQKLEQKSKESLGRSLALHIEIDQEADALISRIDECRQQSHGELEEKISSRMRELDEHRVALTAMMSRSQESRLKLLRALEEASSDVAILESTSEAKRYLMVVLEEEVSKVDSLFAEEMMVSVVGAARDMCKLNAIFEIRSRRAGLDRSRVLLSRGAGSIGEVGQLDAVYGQIDILIPAGGSVTDALLFVADSQRIRVFNVSTGEFVRDILGDGQLGGSLYDLLICNTGPQGIPELYLCEGSYHHIAVLDPLTGGHIRDIGRGQGADIQI